MLDDIFDFGFTVVTEEELETVTKANQNTDELRFRLDLLYYTFQPLLDNLKNNPEKDYIFWPNRVEKVEAFQARLKQIYLGE
jgi:hypothetical protein